MIYEEAQDLKEGERVTIDGQLYRFRGIWFNEMLRKKCANFAAIKEDGSGTGITLNIYEV